MSRSTSRVASLQYQPKDFDLHGLEGISDRTLSMHLKLYEGYVKASNTLRQQIDEMLGDGRIDREEMPAYSELNRRLAFEYNGMRLHELYFTNLSPGGTGRIQTDSSFGRAAGDSFGSFDRWREDFVSVGMMRGIGWAICYLDPACGRLSNHWISSHEYGHVAGFVPLLVLDVWEHAYLLDYSPSERSEYIDAFFRNVRWALVDERLDLGAPK